MYVQIYTHTVHTFTFTHMHSPHTLHTHTLLHPHAHFSLPPHPILTFLLLSWASTALSHTPPPPSPAPPHTPLPLPAPPQSQFSFPHTLTLTHTSPSPCTPTLTVLLPTPSHSHSHFFSLHPHTHSSPSPCTPHTSPSLALQYSLFLHSSLWPPSCHGHCPPLQLQLIHQVEKGVVLTLRDAHRQLLEKDIGKKAWLICTSQGTRGLVPCETYLTVDRIDDIR